VIKLPVAGDNVEVSEAPTMSLTAGYHRYAGRHDWLVWACCSAARRRSSKILNERGAPAMHPVPLLPFPALTLSGPGRIRIYENATRMANLWSWRTYTEPRKAAESL